MSVEASTRRRRDDVYNGLKTSLDLLASIVNISPVPGLEGIITTVKTIIDIVEGAKHNKQACYDICVKINKLIDMVHVELKVHDDLDTDKGTRMRVEALESSLADVARKLSELAQENAFRRAINRVADAGQIQDLNNEVDECINNFMLGTQLSTGMDVKYLRDEAVRLRLADGLDTGGWRSDRRCHPGTRKRYLARIWEWVRSSDGPAVCWLNGAAGSGKSSIAHELAATLHAKHRPYSCFFFRHDDGSLALSAIRLLAYGLSFVSGLRELVIQAMEQSNDTRVNPTMEEQFVALIVTPLQDFASISPLTTVVLVIDGMDECPADIRASFLAAIRSGAPLLPSTVKIFLTSRPHGDVRGHLETLEKLEIPVAVGVGRDDGDVELFLQHELERITKAAGLEERTWSASEIKRDASALAGRAGGLFQWARLLSSLLVNRVRPREVVSRVLGAVGTSATPEINLDVLYTEALNIALPTVADDRDLEALYRRVVGTVLAAKQPLTVSAICTLLKAEEDGKGDAFGTIRALLENLGCVLVLYPISGGAIVVRIAHPSFSDYVTSQDRCPSNWFVQAHDASVKLGSRCFSLMAKSLRRDICKMGAPSVTNKNVSSDTIYQYIVTGLRYACSHAFTHIGGNGGNIRMLETFLKEKLLEWLEAMSLMRHLDTAVELMQQALSELNQQNVAASASSIEILQDAIRFVGRFGSIMDKSAIHVYFSALPFTPHGTTLYRVYSTRYRDIPHVTHGHSESWPEELCTVRNLGGNDRTPRQLAFSADSSRLGISTPTHVVIASPVTGVQLGKYRLGGRDPRASGSVVVAELPIIAFGCNTAFLASITSGLLLRIADSRSLKEVQLELPPSSTDRSPSPESEPEPLVEVTCAAFDQTVNTLCVGCINGRIQLWKLRRSFWEPERDGFPYSHSSAVICVAVASGMLASISQRELKIGPCGDSESKHGNDTRETLTLTPKWLPAARDIRLSFAASSAVAAAWFCAVSLRSAATDDHSVYVVTSTDQRGKKIFSSDSSSYRLHAISPDGAVLTIVCDDVLLRFSTTSYSLLEKRTVSGINTRLDRFPVISPDCRLVAVCDGEVVHIRDLAQPPVKHPYHSPKVKAIGVVMTKHCYIVKGGKQQWLARVRTDGTAEDIVQLGEHEIEHLAVSLDGTRVAALSFYQGKTRHGLLEIANLHSKRRSTTTWPVALHDSFTDWEICNMEFSATGKHVGIVFFLANASYVCACDLESGSLRWKQLGGKMRPLAARSLHGEELIVVRTRDVWKIDLGSASAGGIVRHELYNSDPYKMATFYARFTETESSGSLLEIASRLWDKPPRYTVWNLNADTVGVAPEAEEKATRIKPAITHLEVPQKDAFGHWVLSNVGQRVCCIPEEYCANWGVKAQSSVGRDRLALITGSGTLLVVDFRPMMEYLNRIAT